MINHVPRSKCVVIGASHAGSQFALSLRAGGWLGSIIVVGAEPELPYHRPPISKDYLIGGAPVDVLWIKPGPTYSKNAIELVLGVTADTIDRAAKTVSLSDGKTLGYDVLVLAMGARARRPPIAGVDKLGVHVLRTAADADEIRNVAQAGTRCVIVGGGFIGLEAAASLIERGVDVTVLETAPRLLGRVVAPEVAEWFQHLHQSRGVKVKTGVTITAVVGDDKVDHIVCNNGDTYRADFVVLGTGVEPNISLARSAGLAVNNGIVTDAQMRTSDANIYALGDCSFFYSSLYERWLRLESVQGAVEQARIAAASLCGGPPTDFPLPWFWSHQYETKLQIAGLSEGYDDVLIKAGSAKDSFSAWYFRADRLIAVDAINDPATFVVARKVLANGPTVNRACIESVGGDIRSILKETVA